MSGVSFSPRLKWPQNSSSGALGKLNGRRWQQRFDNALNEFDEAVIAGDAAKAIVAARRANKICESRGKPQIFESEH